MAVGLRAPHRAELSRPLLSADAPVGSSRPGRRASGNLWRKVEAGGPRPSGAPFERDFFERPVEDVARNLLGAVVESRIDDVRCSLLLVEVEAYGGSEDPASHAATRSGVTDRNRAMFGPSGRAYIYRSYGVHWCLNVVTGPEGAGQAVLFRGGMVLAGEPAMLERRFGRTPVAAGPGRLAQALGVTDAFYGHDLREGPLRLQQGWAVGEAQIGVSPRVGITTAAERPLRFYVRGAPGVSGHPR